jgi:hypothetical protein
MYTHILHNISRKDLLEVKNDVIVSTDCKDKKVGEKLVGMDINDIPKNLGAVTSVNVAEKYRWYIGNGRPETRNTY